MVTLAVAIANQWAGTFSQSASFGTTAPALQSVVVALTSGTSVGGGSGTPTAGNWLFCIVGMSEQATKPGFTVGVGDDIHSFWRPGNESTSTWAVSTATSALTRTAIWYTANTSAIAGNVYVAPTGAFDALTVLVVEVSGLGAWDTVTGINTNYAAAATSLSLSLGAPSAQAFILGAVAGDSTTATQTFAPASWTTLHTTSATNGTDHTSDSYLTSAWITTSGSVSVSGAAVSATDLSGVLIGVLTSASTPVPATNNPNWPYVKFEAAFGGGFQTPQDQLTWTDLTARLWSWNETTGIQFQLGNIQATELNLELDNWDNALASDWPGSPYYSNALNANMTFQPGTTAATASGTNNWIGVSGATIAQSTTHTYASSAGATATYSLQVTPNGVTANPAAWSEQAAVTANATYTASAWFYVQAGYGSGAQMQINWYTSGHSLISSSFASIGSVPAATWTQVTVTATAPGTAAYAQLAPQLLGTPSAATVFWLAEAALAAGSSAVSTGLITTGTPIRIRAAVGTLQGTTTNRWYCIQRNMEQWPQTIDPAFRRKVDATATDIWSILSASGPTPYRGEVEQDNPYAWWPMDDQPTAGGVQPTTLRNAANGNTTTLAITAAPGGVSAANAYSTTGTDLTATGTSSTTPPFPSVAVYSVGQNQGWMYGDPQASPQSYSTGNPVTASPGSASWQQSGILGNSGAPGWFLIANDSGFPALSGGVTIEGWFNATFFGSASGYTAPSLVKYVVAGQPYANLTLCTLSTNTAPVCELQMDRDTGHLNLITFSGTTPTTNSVYTSSDLRSGSWVSVNIVLTTTTWKVYVNGGLTATASGSATGMTSAWTYLTLNGDYGNTSGGGTPANLTHGGNVAYSHWSVYSSQLPAWRILAHYCAAITAFGQLPAPQTLSLSKVANKLAGQGYTPDGSEFQGSYGIPAPSTVGSYTFAAVAVAQAGSYTSGPSAETASAGWGTDNGGTFYGDCVWVSWTSLCPTTLVYNASSANAETNAASVCGSGDSFTTGYGSSASGHGVCQTAAGDGSSPPSSASALGDTVAQRLERILTYGGAAVARCIDAASLAVQAATDIGGQQTGPNLQNVTQSDGGMMYIDNLGLLTYWQKSHLAGQFTSPVWTIGPANTPYYREIQWTADPQRVWNAILIQPFSPDGASLADVVPTSATAVNTSQKQYGAQPKSITSYLQSTSEMQTQANFLFTNFGGLRVRADNVKVDAAPAPGLFPMVLGANVGDLSTIQNWQVGGGGITDTFRITRLKRVITFGGDDVEDGPRAELVITADPEPSSWWS